MGYRYGVPIQDRGHEGAGKGIASTYGICHLHLWSHLERDVAWGEDIGAVGATGEHKHIEIVLAKDEPAFVFDVEARIAEHTTDEHQFLVVNLQNVASADAFLNNLLGVELLAQVDVEDFQAVVRRSIQELLDSGSAHNVTLCQ